MPSSEQPVPKEAAPEAGPPLGPPASLQRLTGFVARVKQRTRLRGAGRDRSPSFSNAAAGATARAARAFAQQITGNASLTSRLRRGGGGSGSGQTRRGLADQAPHRVYAYRFRSPLDTEPLAFPRPRRQSWPALPGTFPGQSARAASLFPLMPAASAARAGAIQRFPQQRFSRQTNLPSADLTFPPVLPLRRRAAALPPTSAAPVVPTLTPTSPLPWPAHPYAADLTTSGSRPAGAVQAVQGQPFSGQLFSGRLSARPLPLNLLPLKPLVKAVLERAAVPERTGTVRHQPFLPTVLRPQAPRLQPFRSQALSAGSTPVPDPSLPARAARRPALSLRVRPPSSSVELPMPPTATATAERQIPARRPALSPSAVPISAPILSAPVLSAPSRFAPTRFVSGSSVTVLAPIMPLSPRVQAAAARQQATSTRGTLRQEVLALKFAVRPAAPEPAMRAVTVPRLTAPDRAAGPSLTLRFSRQTLPGQTLPGQTLPRQSPIAQRSPLRVTTPFQPPSVRPLDRAYSSLAPTLGTPISPDTPARHRAFQQRTIQQPALPMTLSARLSRAALAEPRNMAVLSVWRPTGLRPALLPEHPPVSPKRTVYPAGMALAGLPGRSAAPGVPAWTLRAPLSQFTADAVPENGVISRLGEIGSRRPITTLMASPEAAPPMDMEMGSTPSVPLLRRQAVSPVHVSSVLKRQQQAGQTLLPRSLAPSPAPRRRMRQPLTLRRQIIPAVSGASVPPAASARRPTPVRPLALLPQAAAFKNSGFRAVGTQTVRALSPHPARMNLPALPAHVKPFVTDAVQAGKVPAKPAPFIGPDRAVPRAFLGGRLISSGLLTVRRRDQIPQITWQGHRPASRPALPALRWRGTAVMPSPLQTGKFLEVGALHTTGQMPGQVGTRPGFSPERLYRKDLEGPPAPISGSQKERGSHKDLRSPAKLVWFPQNWGLGGRHLALQTVSDPAAAHRAEQRGSVSVSPRLLLPTARPASVFMPTSVFTSLRRTEEAAPLRRLPLTVSPQTPLRPVGLGDGTDTGPAAGSVLRRTGLPVAGRLISAPSRTNSPSHRERQTDRTRPALPLPRPRSAAQGLNGETLQRQKDGHGAPVSPHSSAMRVLPSPAQGVGPGLQVIQREIDVQETTSVSADESADDAEGGRAGTPEAGQDVNLLAYEVWSILKARIGYEAERMGRR